jgi:hypothetical protein
MGNLCVGNSFYTIYLRGSLHNSLVIGYLNPTRGKANIMRML